MQEETEKYLAKARELHGDICPGLVLGTRLALAGMRAMSLDPAERNRDLIVFVEVDRCMTDAVQAVTGRSLGHRNLKYVDYGRFAAVLYDISSHKAVRVSPRREREEGVGDIIQYWRTAPEEELVRIEEVEVKVEADDLPGKPRSRVPCSKCGELIFDNRAVSVGGKPLCRACASGAYYLPVTKERFETGGGGAL
jgi:formylmethanofuran dehydrogenase subunit E